MDKKALILSGSPGKNGNSDILCDEFLRGAVDGGNWVEKIRIAEKNIGFCRGCCACQDTGACVLHDGMDELSRKMSTADIIVLASPISYFAISAPLKTLLERTFAFEKDVQNKQFYYIVSAADKDIVDEQIAIACFRGYAGCLKYAQEMGIPYAMGVYKAGEVRNTEALIQAYAMGRNV